MRRFMIDIIHNLDVGPNATRVGVIQYSSQVQNVFSLKSFFTRAEMEKAINSIVPLAQGTMTGLAIQYAMNVAFTIQDGARPLHRKIPRVAVIVTDGRPQDRVTEVAAQARAAGIEIYAVGVQRADMNSLRAMASPPLEEHVFLVESFDLIQQFGKQFQDKLCVINFCNFNNHSCQHDCVNIVNGYFCRCHDGFTLQADGKTCQANDLCNIVEHGCEFKCLSTSGSYRCVCPEGQQLQADKKTCNKCKAGHIDLVMVIDGSKSVRPQNFELVKQFVNQIVDFLDVSPQGTHVGLVQYSSRVRTEFPLNRFTAADDVKEAVQRVQYMEKGTMTGLALKHMVEHSFSEAEGARPLSQNIPRIGLVFTDGRSQDDISEWARKGKESGIIMFAVGVGKAVEEELREIASEPVDQHFSYSADFNTMTHIVDNLKFNICPEEGTGTTEIRSPCECAALVQFQTNTIEILQDLTNKIAQMTARLDHLENKIANKK
ncbi:matrilin-4 [Protobothrops mucrosquamatus]|uniref:matrilin-4 n=1 Tax=Protobothrops mucrosquamatus TaxID=103944 RepID=UPI0007757952|nr:matrilin-4 [Protobothrops mucrosquamatus]